MLIWFRWKIIELFSYSWNVKNIQFEELRLDFETRAWIVPQAIFHFRCKNLPLLRILFFLKKAWDQNFSIPTMTSDSQRTMWVGKFEVLDSHTVLILGSEFNFAIHLRNSLPIIEVYLRSLALGHWLNKLWYLTNLA